MWCFIHRIATDNVSVCCNCGSGRAVSRQQHEDEPRPTGKMINNSTSVRLLKVCLPTRGKRQRDYLIFLFHFDVELVVRQRDENHAISKNCTCTIFTASSPGIKKCLK